MKIPPAPHSWRLTPRQAIAVQRKLAGLVRVVSPLREPQRTRDTGVSVGKQTGRMTGGTHFRLVAGLDAAFSLDGQQCLAAVVLWDVTEREVIEQQTAVRKLTFPYIPGLLSFREAPALLGALRKLRRVPDVLMCDGQGIAHPRRLGIASHVAWSAAFRPSVAPRAGSSAGTLNRHAGAVRAHRSWMAGSTSERSCEHRMACGRSS